VADSFVDPGPLRLVPADVRLFVIAKTARIPFDCVVVRSDLARPLAKRLRSALLAMSADDATREALADTLGINGFVPAALERYESVAKRLALDQAD
jgi:ABC-type phosphate/phosphonate transport system substrate-binding protein